MSHRSILLSKQLTDGFFSTNLQALKNKQLSQSSKTSTMKKLNRALTRACSAQAEGLRGSGACSVRGFARPQSSGQLCGKTASSSSRWPQRQPRGTPNLHSAFKTTRREGPSSSRDEPQGKPIPWPLPPQTSGDAVRTRAPLGASRLASAQGDSSISSREDWKAAKVF